MVNQITNQTIRQKIIDSIPLCSRCMVHEINSWIADKRGAIDPDATQQIREELKDVKLASGSCLVCNHDKVSANTFENILKIFEKNKIESVIVNEFKKLFGYLE